MRVFRFVLWAAICMSMVSPAFAQQPVQANPDDIKDVFKTLQAPNANEPPRVLKSTEGFLRFIGAPDSGHFAVSPAKSATPEATAQAFLSEHHKAFCIGSANTNYAVTRTRSAHGQTYIHLTQTYKGIDVFGSGMMIQINADHGVACVLSDIMRDSTALDNGAISTTPTLNAGTAQTAAIAWMVSEYGGISAEYEVGQTADLNIYDPAIIGISGSKCLAWTLTVSNLQGSAAEKILIDAHTGSVAFHYPLVHSVKVRKIHDAKSVPFSLGTLIRNEGDPPTGIADADNAYTFFGDTYDFYYNVHGRDSIDNHGLPMVGTINYCEFSCPWANAGWSDVFQRMVFGQGYASADDVISHELTHGVTTSESNLIYAYEPGAINEAFSDIWGEFVDLTNGRGTDTDAVRWLMGEDIPIGAIRSMSDPTIFGDPDRRYSPFYYEGPFDNGGVHWNSGVINKLAYLLTDGDTFQGYTIEGIGIPKAAELFYELQTNILTPSSGFHDFYMALGQAAANLGYSFSEKLNVRAAAQAVEINPPSDNDNPVRAFRALPTFDNLGRPVMSLNWINPAVNFGQVVLVRNTGAYPSTPEDGIEIYRGTAQKFLDTLVTAGTRYYYSLFVDVTSGFPTVAYANALAGATVPPFLTEVFSKTTIGDFNRNLFDLSYTQILYSPTGAPQTAFGVPATHLGDYSGYEATIRKNVFELPVAREDANGGSYNVPMTDDGLAQLMLPRPFPFFGVPQHSAYFSSNGYIAFNSVGMFSDDNFPSAVSHFAIPRISFLFADLNPGAGGSIWGRDLDDRMVLTYENVPEYDGFVPPLPNTVQVELFYSGHIQVTYQDVNASIAICGLSDGLGIPADPAVLFPDSSLTGINVGINISNLPQSATALSISPITPPDVETGETVTFTAYTDHAGVGTPALSAQWSKSALAPFIDNGDGTGTFFWVPELLDAGLHTARITATLGSQTAYQDVTIWVGLDEPLPVASNLRLRTDTLIEDPTRDRVIGSRQPLTAEYTYSHALELEAPQLYAEGATRIQWYKDNLLLLQYNNSLMIPKSAVRSNSTWHFEVTPRTLSGLEGPAYRSPTVTVIDLPEILNVALPGDLPQTILPEDLPLPNVPLAAGPSAGGTHVVILGRKLSQPISVLIGGIPVQSVLSQSDMRLEVLTPAHVPSPIVNGQPVPDDIRLTTAYGTGIMRGAFSYVDSGAEISEADVNRDGHVDAVDVQLVINAVLQMPKNTEVDPDVNRDGHINVLDIQTVVVVALDR